MVNIRQKELESGNPSMYDLLKIPDEFLQLLHHPYYVTNMFWIKDSLLIPRIGSGPCAHKQKKA